MKTTNRVQRKGHIFTVLLALGGIFAGNSLNAQEPAVEPDVRQIMPAVVRITGYMRTPGTENEYRKYGESSGFFVDETGVLFTVYSGYVDLENKMLCDKFEVKLFDGRVLHARIYSMDPVLDLALLKMTEEDEYPALDISFSPDVDAGEEVRAIAGKKSPGESLSFSGRVKAKDKTSMYGDGYSDLLMNIYMELPAYAYGGPLVNNDGEVLGINISYPHQDTNGEEASGEEHAIPVGDIKTIYQLLLANPTFEQRWLGFSVRPISLQQMALVKQVLQQRGGVVIDFIWNEGPASNTGIRRGDILVGMNGTPILTPNHFTGTLFETANNTPAELKIIRDGAILTEQGRVEKRPLWAAP